MPDRIRPGATGATDDVLRYRVDELERRAEGNEELAERRKTEQDEVNRDLERNHQATVRVVDSVVLKVTFFAFLGAAVATALINWIVMHQLGK